jgi:hypothetical protein
MSQVYPTIDGWIGYGDGASVLVSTGEPMDSDHPLVKQRPELFVPAGDETPSPKRRGRPVGSKNRPKDGTDG